jgi:hypothetical protein
MSKSGRSYEDRKGVWLDEDFEVCITVENAQALADNISEEVGKK